MTATNYAYQMYDEEKMARAYGRGLSISTKKSVEVCKWLSGKSVKQAKIMLEEVIVLKRAVPYRRFNQELAHQRATGSGGYPVNVAKAILAILKSAESNASAKGLSASSLKIAHICAHLGSRPFRYGRKRRVKAKRTHIEIVLEEGKDLSKKTSTAKTVKKYDKKVNAVKPKVEKSENVVGTDSKKDKVDDNKESKLKDDKSNSAKDADVESDVKDGDNVSKKESKQDVGESKPVDDKKSKDDVE